MRKRHARRGDRTFYGRVVAHERTGSGDQNHAYLESFISPVMILLRENHRVIFALSCVQICC